MIYDGSFAFCYCDDPYRTQGGVDENGPVMVTKVTEGSAVSYHCSTRLV